MTGKRKYVWDGQTFVDVTHWKPPPRRTPYIIRDTMDALVHPANGEVLDSKSRFREVTRAHGLVEVGNDAVNTQNSRTDYVKSRKQDIATAIEMLEQGYTPPPDESVTEWGETRVIGDG